MSVSLARPGSAADAISAAVRLHGINANSAAVHCFELESWFWCVDWPVQASRCFARARSHAKDDTETWLATLLPGTGCGIDDAYGYVSLCRYICFSPYIYIYMYV